MRTQRGVHTLPGAGGKHVLERCTRKWDADVREMHM